VQASEAFAELSNEPDLLAGLNAEQFGAGHHPSGHPSLDQEVVPFKTAVGNDLRNSERTPPADEPEGPAFVFKAVTAGPVDLDNLTAPSRNTT
jgi:hypothetical protein